MQNLKPLEAAYIESLRNNNNRDDTIYTYLLTLRNVERFFLQSFSLSIFSPEDVKQITPFMVSNWMSSVRTSGVADATRAQYQHRLRGYFKWAREFELIDRDLATIIKPFKYDRPENAEDISKVYSDDDIMRMLQIAQSHHNPIMAARNAAIIAMLSGSAMRGIEVESLKVGDYRNATDTRILSSITRKGGSKSNIPFAEFVASYVDAYLALRQPESDDEPLFLSTKPDRKTGKLRPLDRRSVRLAVAAIQKEAGVRTGVHNFRHTVITRVAEANPTGIASAVAGHRSTSVTQNHYIHASDETRRSVVDSLPINQKLKNS